MAIQRVNQFIYRHLVQRPSVGRALDSLGRTLNRVGVKWRTGLTRDIATLRTSRDPGEVRGAFGRLLEPKEGRGWEAVYDHPAARVAAWQNIDVSHVIELRELGIDPRFLHELFFPGQTLRSREMGDRTYRAWIAAARSLREEGLPAEETGQLVHDIWHRIGNAYEHPWEERCSALEEIPEVVRLLREGGVEVDRIAEFLGKIPQEHYRDSNHALRFVTWLHLEGYRFDQIEKLLGVVRSISDWTRHGASYAKENIGLLQASGLNRDETVALLSFLTDRGVRYQSHPVSIAVHLLRRDMSEQEIELFIGRVLASGRQENQDALAGSTSIADKLLSVGYSPEEVLQIMESPHPEARLYAHSFLEDGVYDRTETPYREYVETVRAIESVPASGEHKAAAYRAALELVRYVDHPKAREVLASVLQAGWDTDVARKLFVRELIATLGTSSGLLHLSGKFELLDGIVWLLNDPETPPEQVAALVQVADEVIEKNWSHILSHASGHGPRRKASEVLPRVFRYVAEVMAEKARFVHQRIASISGQTRKPTITVYILSTAYKLNMERPRDWFEGKGLSRDAMAAELRTFRMELGRRVEAGLSRWEAKLAVAREWLAAGRFTRYTEPVFLKIPSGSSPPSHVEERLQEISTLCNRENYDMVFVDHSTVRDPKLYGGDTTESYKGRALARALAIVNPDGAQRVWLYKDGEARWEVPELAGDRPNFVALNIYDGKTYDKSTGAPKQADWLPVDDNGEFVGVSWDTNGKEVRSDYLVIYENGGGELRVNYASLVFNQEFRRALRALETPREKVRVPQRNVLFMCDANHDRSPLLEHLFRMMLPDWVEEGESVQVLSRGLRTNEWLTKEGAKITEDEREAPSAGTRHLLEQRGIGYDGFRKRQVEEEDVLHADIIFVMTRRQQRVLAERFPDVADKIHILRQYAGYEESDWDLPTPKTFDYVARRIFEESLERAVLVMAGQGMAPVRQFPKRVLRKRPRSERVAA